MAGIGWRLDRLIHQGTLSGAAAAYATGAAVMALPWVVTTAVLVSLPAVIGRGVADFTTAETVVNVAYSVALLVDGPLQIVISRYAADRLYERRLRAIAAPFCRGLGVTFVLCHVTAALALLALGLPPGAALWGGALSAAVGAQWTALSVGNGLCSPRLVLGAVGAGAALSFLLAAALVVFTGLGLPGYLFGLVSGQSLTLAILLVGIFRALPDSTDESARLLPAFRDYASLAGAGLAFNASLWVDKLVVWCLVGGDTGGLHAAASTLAWFSTIPCLAWIFVEVETTFHRRFRAFYRALEGGASLPELRSGVRTLAGEAARLLGGAARVQAGVIVFLQVAAGPLARWLRLPDGTVTPFRLLLIAAGMQAITLLGLILLYYFDLRREALFAAGVLLVAVAVCTMAAAELGLPPSVGTLLGCAVGAVVTCHCVHRGVNAVLQHTLLRQPLGAERIDPE
ncbi:MAG: exopolysaccharide Pel transporter PelG [Candidatus Polarisedimenticolia bacterium]